MTSADALRLLVLLPDAADDPATQELLGVLADAGDDALAARAVAWDGGPRLAALRGHLPVSVVADLGGGPAAALERALLRLGRRGAGFAVRRRRLGVRGAIDAVYLTSPRAAPLLRFLPERARPPVVVMVPLGEMTEAEHEPLSDEDRDLLLRTTDRFVVASLLDRLERLGVPSDRIVRIGAPDDGAGAPGPDPARLAELRGRLAVPEGADVLAGSGPLVWRGGADLFVRLLWMLRARRGRDVVGVWVGADADPLERRQLEHDIAHMDLAGRVHLLADDDADALSMADLHVVTSREVDAPEPYRPAAERGQGLVGFRTDVLDRFATDGAGELVEFLDLERLADAVERLLDDAAARTALAGRVRARFEEWHVPPARTRFLLQTLRSAR